MYRPTRAEIHTHNFIHNVEVLRATVSAKHFFCPMVKANAYGHGDIELAKVLERLGVKYLGVALVEEALRLRQAQIKSDILVFHPQIGAKSIAMLVANSLTPVVSSWPSFMALVEAKIPISIHLKFNTGMNRLGFAPNDADSLKNLLSKNHFLTLKGLCTHLIKGDDIVNANGLTRKQLNSLLAIGDIFGEDDVKLHALNSEALLGVHLHNLVEFQRIGARPGLALYGIKPKLESATEVSKDKWFQLDLRPVMSLKSEIVQLQFVKKGETVSYGGLYKVERDSCIAIVPIGYGDGYARLYANAANMICRGHKFKVSGTVCMDYTMFDITQHFTEEKDWLGQTVTLMGQEVDAEVNAFDLADSSSTITYEVLTRFSSRVPRVYL